MFPYSCDALLYHLPIVTVLLIVMNVAVFMGMLSGVIDPSAGWILEYGTGVHPQQWLLSRFSHQGLMHLLGNMFFLWAFGLVTEGKLGWWRFLSVYLVIAVGQAAIEQIAMSGYGGSVPGSLGASAAIFGLLTMACIWAPANSLSVLFGLGLWYFFTFDVSVALFAAIYIGMDILWCLLLGSWAGSSILHLMGAAMGAMFGVVLLKRGVVQCNDWDLFSLWSGKYGRYAQEERDSAPIAADKIQRHQQQQLVEAKRRFDAYLETKQPVAALALRKKFCDLKNPLSLERRDLIGLIVGLHEQRKWSESAPVMAEFLERFPEDSLGVRLKLAQICVVELQRPHKALELLAALPSASLSPTHAQRFQQIRRAAEHQVRSGVLELEQEAW